MSYRPQRGAFRKQRGPHSNWPLKDPSVRKSQNQGDIQWEATLVSDMENQSDNNESQRLNELEENQSETSRTNGNYAAKASNEDNSGNETYYSDEESFASVSSDREKFSTKDYSSLSRQKSRGTKNFRRYNKGYRGGGYRNNRSRGNYKQVGRQTDFRNQTASKSNERDTPLSSYRNDLLTKSEEESCSLSNANVCHGRDPINYGSNYFPNSGNFGRQMGNSDMSSNESLHRSVSICSDNDNYDPNDRLSMWRKAKEEFYSMTKSISSSEIIMDYRKQIETLSNECTERNLVKIDKISSLMIREKEYEKTFKSHYENLLLQQKNFDAYLTSMKHECSVIRDSNTDEIIRRADCIKMHVENECHIFHKTLPSYGYKSNVLEALSKNQVVIIPADSSYFFNIVTPIIVKSELSDYFVTSIESNNMLNEWVRNEIENIVKHNFDNNSGINFQVEDKMLHYLKSDLMGTKNCFIFSPPLKRTVTSDLLLAQLRDILQQEKDYKLILLLSAFDNVKNYERYFSNLKVFLIEVPKLLLPITTVWKKEPLSFSTNYKEDIVCTALSIHILNDPGDVIAFLPNETEAKATLAMFQRKLQELNHSNDNVEGVFLHKNSMDVAQFKRPPDCERRSIIFTTSCAETLPLLSVKYVIDCGLTREYIFNCEKNLDVLTTAFISRAKARLRKNLVGVYVSGTCYRMYNKENFCIDMSSFEEPDILTLNPFNTLIEIYHHQPDNALAMQFVEPLSDIVKYNTVKLLKNFKAIKNGKLTPLGKKMVKLPFPARYSKLILQSIDWGFAYEAVILVAYFSVESYLFKKTKNEELQREIDAAKIELIQHESDTLSFLNAYREWIENECSHNWCQEHHIEQNTMVEIRMKVDEICQIIDECLNENIPKEFANAADSAASIIEILFQCFADNLCVFSGHYRCGYRILSSRQAAFVHPSSILSNKENFPQLIIFNKIKSTTRNFLLGITAIPTDLVLNGLAEKILDFDYSDVFERTLVSHVIEKVGEKIINQVLLGIKGKKLQDIETKIRKELNSDLIIIDPSAEKGSVYVYALQPFLKAAVNKVDEILKSNLEDVINAEQSHILELKKGECTVPVEVKWTMGAKINSVKIKDVAPNNRSLENLHTLEKPAKDITSSVQYSINLTWVRRKCNGACFVGFESRSFMQARKLAMKTIRILEADVFVAVYSKGENELILSDVPEEARASDIEEALKKYLPHAEIIKVAPVFAKPFETTPADIRNISIEIQDNCDEYTDLSDFKVIVPQPKPTATIMTAFINVYGSEDLTEAAEQLSNTLLNDFKVTAIPVYRSVIKSSFKIYRALEDRIDGGIEKLKSELKAVYPDKEAFRFDKDIARNSDLVSFKLLCNDIKVMKRLQRTVNDLLEGEILNKSILKDINKLFCHGGLKWLRTLERSKKVYILEEYNTKTIRVYGSRESCFKVKESILNFLEDTENEAVETIDLSIDKNNRALLKAVIREYGVNLDFFIEVCQLRSAVLDIKSCSLSLHGSRDNIDQAKNLLNKLSSKLDSTEEFSLLSGGEKCPVCNWPAFNLTIRLQHCGHLYCRECISGLVEQAQFPIQCCAENCSEDIVLDDIVRILEDDEEKINKLLHSSLNNFLEKNKSDIFYCPAPDCPMFCYKTEVSEKWKCPLCQNDICKNCNVIYHYGFACDVYQGSKLDPDYSFKIWKKGTAECKECPKCKSAIEKNEGCDHMTCILCSAHFCWVCCREFPNERSVYNHIPFCDQYPRW